MHFAPTVLPFQKFIPVCVRKSDIVNFIITKKKLKMRHF